MTKKKIILGLWAVLAAALLILAAVGCGAKPVDVGAMTPNIPDGELDPAVWGKYYPYQYETYLKNKEVSNEGTKYGGNKQLSHLEKYPYQKILFKGFGFGVEYNEDRGHVYTLEDVRKIKRVNEKTPGSCMTCKSAAVPTLIKQMGEDYYKTPFSQISEKVKQMGDHPITCANCHDNKTMELKITQPPLREALQRLGKDPDKLPRQEMRSLVCAQCHVTYYFKNDTKHVTFPWDNGWDPNDMLKYYDEKEPGFTEWTHPLAGTKMLKARHPEYEMFQGSAHQANGVSCADCHMPYTKQGSQKVSSHWWTSPLKTIEQSCTTCHREDAEFLKNRVLYTQDKVFDMLNRAGYANQQLVLSLEAAGKVPTVNKDLLAQAQAIHRKSQYLWDWVSAENSMGFHNPQKTMATLSESIDLAQQGTMLAEKAAGQILNIPRETYDMNIFNNMH